MNRIHITKRDDLPKNKEVVIRVLAVVLSVVFSGAIILMFGLNPIEIFRSIVEGAVGTPTRIRQTVLTAVPLTIASLGIIVAFKMKFWNIGAEGQITMGALGATIAALFLPENLPAAVMLPCMLAASVVFGGVWAFIPAFFKAKMGTNETIFTLMLNYIAIKFVTYLQYGPWKDPNSGGFPRIAYYPDNALLPSLFGVHVGWILALLSVAFIYFFINYTKKGYEISVVGESLETARYAGMNISRIIITAMLISGGMCGMVGMIQASGIEKTLVSAIANNYGFTAIITAWLSRLNAVSCLFVCIAFAMLTQGGAYIQIALGVPSAVASVVQGTVLFFVLGSEFFLQYKINLAHKGAASKKEVA